jgi:hypothetical protein
VLLDTLLMHTTGVGAGKSLANKVEGATIFYAADNKAETCAATKSLTKELSARAGKMVSRESAVKPSAEADAIRTAIACP